MEGAGAGGQGLFLFGKDHVELDLGGGEEIFGAGDAGVGSAPFEGFAVDAVDALKDAFFLLGVAGGIEVFGGGIEGEGFAVAEADAASVLAGGDLAVFEADLGNLNHGGGVALGFAGGGTDAADPGAFEFGEFVLGALGRGGSGEGDGEGGEEMKFHSRLGGDVWGLVIGRWIRILELFGKRVGLQLWGHRW